MIDTCVFPVAGLGTRFLPATKAVPKEMLPVVDKPLIQYGVEEAEAAGMNRICFVNGRHKTAIENHFDRNLELEAAVAGSAKGERLEGINGLIERCRFVSVRQLEAKGLGHAIGCARPLVENRPFGVILPDDLCVNPGGEPVMAQMAALYQRYQCSIIAIETVPAERVHQYGVIAGEEEEAGVFRVRTLVEKPDPADAPSRLAIIGRYILSPGILDLIDTTAPGKGGEIQITDALQQQAARGDVIAWQFQGRRFDCGSVDGYLEATNYCYERRS